MAVDDLAESSFYGVTSQMQVFCRIGMSSAAAISYMVRNGLLYQPTTTKEMSDKKKIVFHDFPEELHITSIISAVQEALATIHSNTDAMYRQRNSKQ